MGNLYTKEVEKLVKEFLTLFTLTGENFEGTPERVARFWEEFFSHATLNFTTFTSPNREMITLKDYKVWGFCPHHLLPVHYTFRVSYLPKGKVLGLSKLVRLINLYLKDLPLQEDLPTKIVDAVDLAIQPKGVACKVEGMHLCMVMRGVKSEATIVTTALKGIFVDDAGTKEEFLK